ncbi:MULTISPECIES: guanylate kinase [Cylindrospermopsis]|uniref:Guanylate kinase n=3 Tax=Cylindrospermopsis raciborskii TaxID=77022 RepID=A0A853MAV8_9CYAN|nr:MULTISPECIES: guanylate kinase [Cylindrospermopsis]MBU6344585.1 guanylate kinase [Cyanobacteria bacterium REEB494]EFA71041.1 Guanylate kinase [Cylindrospermopsis raciborskii CS-505]KRH95491.1 guanylate kinase [Cylindrospermopsis sp. CR12]MBA4445118.1 guanylate kinase [Cylindrospermopsis raciborskii CS-506_C]MBA4449333.1 guanylate kinase [Cylindrospermopsis raciborskii CS-506_D]
MQFLPLISSATTHPGKLIVLTGPSGVGKGTLMQKLLAQHPQLYYSVSATTRSPRPGEIDGKSYYFITPNSFQELVAQGEFLEWAEFAGNYYGTPRAAVLEQIQLGRSVILEIELAGARQIKASYPDALSIFILPPSFLELENRIRARGQDSDEAITRRLNRAKEEIKAASEFDIQIVNDNFATTLNELETILKTISSFSQL